MDDVSKKFDDWAINGKAESMEKGHGVNVLKFLRKISFNKPFSFLDVGCGNGWVIRYVSDIPTCKKGIGIVISPLIALMQDQVKDLKAKIAIGSSVHPKIIFLHFILINSLIAGLIASLKISAEIIVPTRKSTLSNSSQLKSFIANPLAIFV